MFDPYNEGFCWKGPWAKWPVDFQNVPFSGKTSFEPVHVKRLNETVCNIWQFSIFSK